MSWPKEADVVLSAVIGAVVDWIISTVLDMYCRCAKPSVVEPEAAASDQRRQRQLGRLSMQVIMLKAVVEQAQRVRIRNLSLLTWLSEMRAAALDGEDVLQRAMVERLKRCWD